MPAFKYSMIFTYFSGITAANAVPVRLGGWTESYYAASYDAATYSQFLDLIQKRLGICPVGTVVNKVRVQAVDPAGPAQLTKVRFAAPATWLSDVPQMALKVPFLIGGAAGQILREFRGLPDVQVTTGEYAPTNPFTTALSVFLTELTKGTWQARRRNKSVLQYSILSVSELGVTVMIDAFAGLAQAQRVQVIRTVDPRTGRKFGYFAAVQVLADNQHFTLVGPKVRASNFGTMRTQGIVYTPFSGPVMNDLEAVVRKVGRPSKSYSGRASKRA